MTEVNRTILGGVVVAILSCGLTATVTLNTSNNERDKAIVSLQTTVKDMDERLIREHDEDVKQRSEFETQLRQLQVDTARISQKVGVTADPSGTYHSLRAPFMNMHNYTVPATPVIAPH